MVGPLDPARSDGPAYPTDWTIADTLSHLGSGAVIFLRLVDDSLAGLDTPGDAFPAVWDEWNAKPPGQQGADALVADRALLDRLEGLDDDERRRLRTTLGPMDVDFDGLVALAAQRARAPHLGRRGGRRPGGHHRPGGDGRRDRRAGAPGRVHGTSHR